MLTWITLGADGTSILGWSQSKNCPAKGYVPVDFTPEKPLEAYEYVDVTETQTVPDPDDPENSTIETEVIIGKAVQVRADWVEPTPPE